MKRVTVDGNFAAANIAYMFNDVAFIYPITPSSPMAEYCDQFAYENKKNIFGNKLKELRKEKGLSQRELGKIFNVCNQTISFWETGSREPDLDTLVKISHYFSVTLEYLLEENADY